MMAASTISPSAADSTVATSRMMMSVFLNWAKNSAIGEARSSLASSLATELLETRLRLLLRQASIEACLKVTDEFFNRLAVGLLGLASKAPRAVRVDGVVRCVHFLRPARTEIINASFHAWTVMAPLGPVPDRPRRQAASLPRRENARLRPVSPDAHQTRISARCPSLIRARSRSEQ